VTLFHLNLIVRDRVKESSLHMMQRIHRFKKNIQNMVPENLLHDPV